MMEPIIKMRPFPALPVAAGYAGLSLLLDIYSSFGFSKRGLKAQCSTQPRASEATPWGFRIVESPRPVRAKALTLDVIILT